MGRLTPEYRRLIADLEGVAGQEAWLDGYCWATLLIDRALMGDRVLCAVSAVSERTSAVARHRRRICLLLPESQGESVADHRASPVRPTESVGS
jgi:hypothetical protein